MGPRARLEGCRKSCHHRDSIPRPSSPWQVAIPTELSRYRMFLYRSFNITIFTVVCNTLMNIVRCRVFISLVLNIYTHCLMKYYASSRPLCQDYTHIGRKFQLISVPCKCAIILRENISGVVRSNGRCYHKLYSVCEEKRQHQ